MSSTLSSTVVSVNVLIYAIYVVVASITGRFLLLRADALRQETELRSRIRQHKQLARPRASMRINNVDTSSETESLTGSDDTVTSSARPELQDYVSWFFLLIVSFTLLRAATVFSTNLVKSTDVMRVSASRTEQDLVMFPSSLLYYSVSVVLLHTFYYMSDVGDPKPLPVYRLRIILLLGGEYVFGLASVVLTVTKVWVLAIESTSTAFGLALGIGYGITAVVVPKKVLRYGEELSDLARRVRSVSWIMCFCMIGRGIFIMPPLQNSWSILGDFGMVISLPFDLIPTILSIFILHRSRKNRVGGG